MTAVASRILDEALRLNEVEREQLLQALVASLRSPLPEVDAAWIVESNRRMAEFLAGREASFDAEDMVRDLEQEG